MLSAGLIIGAVAAMVAVYLAVRSYLRVRGARVVSCPENRQKAEVRLDARRAAVGQSARLSACTRWPEKQGCGQECLAEIAQKGDACLIRNILTKWYEGRNCAFCGAPFEEIDWATRKPGLAAADGTSIDWSQVHAGSIDEMLAGYRPVCFTCSVTNTFVRRHPELVVDRTARPH